VLHTHLSVGDGTLGPFEAAEPKESALSQTYKEKQSMACELMNEHVVGHIQIDCYRLPV